ncbi:hypothetical protein [Nitrincola sp. MINF-07-Sa-05]|uniref:hypothetical protein n=1 Tax=Nitrincola salilacus TaxID=3400273 RepID=UPI00391845E9
MEGAVRRVMQINITEADRVWLWAIAMMTLATFPAVGWAGCLSMRASYEVEVDGHPFGNMSIERRTEGIAMDVISRTHLHMTHWSGDIEIRSVTVEQYKNGFRKADTRVLEDGSTKWSRAVRQEDELWMSTTHVKIASEAEVQALVEATSGLLIGMTPDLVDVLPVVQLFTGSDKPDNRVLRIGVDEVDTSLLNLPCFWIESAKQLPHALNLLDTEELTVFEFILHEASNESMVVNAKELVSLQSYTYQNGLGQGLQVWLGMTELGPVIARLDWRDDDVSYHLKLIGVQKLEASE